jgi:beta-lactamase regulating signal transducer with metallopeptidase domain
MIEQINHITQLWWSGTIAMFWQVGVLIILIGCVDLIIRRWAWPQLRYALWLMVLIKLVLPPTISLSTSVTSGLQPLARQIVAKEIHRENLNTTTAMLLANLETAAVESPVEGVSYPDIVTERQPVIVFTGSENVAGESLNAGHVKPVWQAYAMAVWLAGMFILGGWLIIKLLHLRKEDHKLAATASLPESFYDSMARCAKSLGLRRAPKVVLTRKVACPAVFGVVRPVLLMPVGYLSKMTRRDTEHMLLHEFAHIKRGDLWVHGFYMLLQVVYWYNPLLWLVRNQMHHLRELCCDATVARLLKERISEYRQTLIDVARRYLTKPTEPGLGLLGLFEDSNRLLVRLNWLKKETWRYQKMKKLTVITTIVLMLAFVLPMAQAQDKPSTENSSAETIKVEVQPSQTQETVETGQDENEPQAQEQLLQAKQALQAQLQQLEIQKQKLQQQLQALTQARQAEIQAKQAEVQAKVKAKEAKDKAEKASKESEKAKASDDGLKAAAEAKRWEQWANSDQFKQWQKGMESWSQQWANSDEFKQWQMEMEQWAKEHAKAHENATSSDNVPTSAPKPHPMPAMPPMPVMPPMPTPVEVVAPAVVAPVPPAAPVAVEPVSPAAPTMVVPKVEPHSTGTAIVAPPAEIAAPVLPNVPDEKSESTPNIKIEKDKDGEYIATKEMHFVAKVKSGIPFIVRDGLGNITLKPSKDNTCDVRAVIRAKAKKADEAQQMAEQVGMNIESSNERYYLKPVKPDGDKWNNLNVDFYIAVPVGVRPDVKTDLGNIDLTDLKGDIIAVTNLGNVKAVNTAGNVNLRTDLGKVEFIAPKDMAGGDVKLITNLGDIEFTAPKDLSAKLQVQTKMGEIESELPLEINRFDMFKRNAEGTLGAGQANIKMATEMGKIHLKWQSSSQVEVKF